jgi:hypothetical protein
MFFEVAQTIAEISGALIGFVGVVFVLGGRADRILAPVERSGLFHLLVGSVGALLLSVTTMIAVAALEEGFAWRISAGVAAAWTFSGAAKAIIEELRGEHSLPTPINWLLPIAAFCVGAFNLAAATYVPHLAPLSSVLAMLTGLVVAITYFISLLTGHSGSSATVNDRTHP